MIRKKFSLEITEIEDIAELSAEDRLLITKSREILLNAYAPYSGFSVGAAVLLENGEIITGNNQENAAYPSGLCAERTAVFYANAQYPGVAIKSIAISAGVGGKLINQPAYPCGACRQVLLESRNKSGKPMRVILAGAEKTEIVDDARDLLPMPFESLD